MHVFINLRVHVFFSLKLFLSLAGRRRLGSNSCQHSTMRTLHPGCRQLSAGPSSVCCGGRTANCNRASKYVRSYAGPHQHLFCLSHKLPNKQLCHFYFPATFCFGFEGSTKSSSGCGNSYKHTKSDVNSYYQL